MLLFIHVILAFAGLAVCGYGVVRPSAKTIKTSFALVALTFLTGIYLIFSRPAHIASACLSGLLYLGGAGFMLAIAKHKLAGKTLQ